MQQASIDPRTGQIDMDVIQTGVSAADRTMRGQLVGELKALLEQQVSACVLRRGWDVGCVLQYERDAAG
jgi:hypothetical protein